MGTMMVFMKDVGFIFHIPPTIFLYHALNLLPRCLAILTLITIASYSPLFQRFRTAEPVDNVTQIFTSFLTHPHPWYFGFCQDLVQINL